MARKLKISFKFLLDQLSKILDFQGFILKPAYNFFYNFFLSYRCDSTDTDITFRKDNR